MKKLKVGDKIRIESPILRYTVTIGRVTKTMAITNPINSASATIRFKIEYFDNGDCRRVEKIKWNTTSYTIVKQ